MAGLVIKPRSRIFHGHDWVYATEVLKSFGEPQDGEIVSLKDGQDRLLGSAIYNRQSQIIARRFSRQRQDLDRDFFERRLRLARTYRKRHGLDPRLGRLVWSESDGLPGVIVDRYEETLVVQTLTLAMDRRLPVLVEALQSIFAPRNIIERNDAPIRQAEGLELRTGVLVGEDPGSVPIQAAGLRFQVNLLQGQKTGFYLDQVGNYAAVAAYAQGRRVLDCFSNQGAFALACARAGAAGVTAIEISAEACGQIRRHGEQNGLSVEAVEANAFDFLRQAEAGEQRWDLIILDPPSFTRSKGKLHDAMRGYKELHLRALKLLNPDGLLATFCCSHHVSKEHFQEMIIESCVDARRTVRQLGTFTQGLDHPILPTLPETEYLQGALFELVPGR